MLSGHSGILLLTPVERKNIFFSLLFFSEHLSVHRGIAGQIFHYLTLGVLFGAPIGGTIRRALTVAYAAYLCKNVMFTGS
jgi:hypothetical protein